LLFLALKIYPENKIKQENPNEYLLFLAKILSFGTPNSNKFFMFLNKVENKEKIQQWTDDKGNNFLHYAVRTNDIDIFNILSSKYKINRNHQNKAGNSPLMHAVVTENYYHPRKINKLIEEIGGFALYLKNTQNNNLLLLLLNLKIISQEDAELIKNVINRTENLDICNLKEQTAWKILAEKEKDIDQLRPYLLNIQSSTDTTTRLVSLLFSVGTYFTDMPAQKKIKDWLYEEKMYLFDNVEEFSKSNETRTNITEVLLKEIQTLKSSNNFNEDSVQKRLLEIKKQNHSSVELNLLKWYLLAEKQGACPYYINKFINESNSTKKILSKYSLVSILKKRIKCENFYKEIDENLVNSQNLNIRFKYKKELYTISLSNFNQNNFTVELKDSNNIENIKPVLTGIFLGKLNENANNNKGFSCNSYSDEYDRKYLLGRIYKEPEFENVQITPVNN